ncbi:indoleamine 2,3-dioxygenase 2-like [Amphiura filiformis]|uniref:indoleamine 2,3-dioxygenase 2-like n=1 Tax=Amphiura filiformis TaxID=82378 RepID=UPI003B2189AC
MATVPRLEDYHVSSTYGFLLQDPLTTLPDYFQPWMAVANRLEECIANETIREEIHKLPLLDHTRLSGHKALRLAQVVLSCLTQGYVWSDGEDGIPTVLPKQLAIPYAGVSEQLGVPPSISVYSFGLANWKLKDSSQPPSLENLEAIITVRGGSHSNWFYMNYVANEIAAAPGLAAIANAQQAVKDGNIQGLSGALQAIQASIKQIQSVLSRMNECCDPEIFYSKIRPFLTGWDSPAFKTKGLDGLIYDGVSKQPKKLVGGTAAQSSILPSFDAALGVQAVAGQKSIMELFAQYMPPPHRNFINAISSGPSIKDYVFSSGNKQLQGQFNDCLAALEQWRSYHIQLVTRYVVAMAGKSQDKKFVKHGLAGTGGTDYMEFLKKMRDASK